MKKGIFLLLWAASALAGVAQTLVVNVGGVSHRFPAEKTGNMVFNAGTSLSVMNNTFVLSEVSGLAVDGTSAANVTADYAGTPATVVIADEQTAQETGSYDCASNSALLNSAFGGVRINFQMEGVTHVELESVDGYKIATGNNIITCYAPDGGTFTPGKDYYIATFPADVYGGYRLSIYKDGLVADYFAVHQTIEAGEFITPPDLVESELEFDDPDAPLVEEERPGLNQGTKDALVKYQHDPTEENKEALLEQMGLRYDKVVARKKAKLRELEREAKQYSLVEEMQAIVDEMTENREIRLEQQFLRLIDPREDDDTTDAWMVLRGADANNPYIGYAPVTNAEYAAYDPSFVYAEGQDNYPVVNVTLSQAAAYCDWLTANDEKHSYRLPSEEEWILAAGHMPKDVKMNSDHVERGLTPVDAYAQTTGACGGIDFWGNSWEWTTTQTADGLYIVKGGSWDSSRDACRSEYSDDVRDANQTYANVGFRVVRVDK